MENYNLGNVDIEFNTNEVFLLTQMIYRLESLENKLNRNDSMSHLLNNINEFKMVLDNNKTKLEEFNTYKDNAENKNMWAEYGEYIESFAQINMEELKAQNPKMSEAIEELINTDLFKEVQKLNNEYSNEIAKRFKNQTETHKEQANNIVGKTNTKKIIYMPFTPELFSIEPCCLRDKNNNGEYAVEFTIPTDKEEFEEMFGMEYTDGIESVILFHEKLHADLPTKSNDQFENNMQRELDCHLKHTIIELLANGEMGINIANHSSYFESTFHSGKISYGDKTLTTNDLQKFDIKNNDLLNTEANEISFDNTEHFSKDDMGIIKIRGMMYPYVLMYKNRNNSEQIQIVKQEIQRDEEYIKEIYGEEFLKRLQDENFLSKAQQLVKPYNNLLDFAEGMSKDLLGIEQIKNIEKNNDKYIIEEHNIEEKSINIETQQTKKLKKNEILILLQAIENTEMDVITSYIDDVELKNTLQNLWEENRYWEERDNIESKYLSNIAKQISEEDYSFLKSRINSRSARSLICATGNTEYIKECIDTLDLDIDNKVFLVSATKDEKYIKDFFYANKDKMLNWQKANLIIATKDNEFIKECVDDETLQLEDTLKSNMISSTGDIEYIKECIENQKLNFLGTFNLIGATKDSEYIRDKIENSNLQMTSSQVMKLLKISNDKSFIKEYLNGNRLEIEDKLDLIETIKNDVEFVKNFITTNVGLINKDNLIRVIALTKDADYIYEAINDKTLELSDKEKSKIILQTKNPLLAEKYMQETKNLSAEDRKIFEFMLNPDVLNLKREEYKKIKLPKGMTIGIEIESEGEYGVGVPRKILNGRWKTKADASLENGIEIVSTILGGSEQDSKEIYEICELLEEIGQSTSERCGAHVHIGADFLTNKQAYINLLEIFGNCEEIIYAISNDKNNNVRKGISKYCLPIAKKLEDSLISGNLDSEEELNKFVEQIQTLQENRYSGINFMNVGATKNTIEFRTPNGTISPEVWIENINLFGGMIKTAQELSIIQMKDMKNLTNEDKEKLMFFSKIKSQDADQKDKLDALLSLTVEEKMPYVERYNQNILLMQENKEITETMKKAKLSQALDIRTIGKSILTGDNAVRGEEIAKVETIFFRDIEQVKEGEKIYE